MWFGVDFSSGAFNCEKQSLFETCCYLSVPMQKQNRTPEIIWRAPEIIWRGRRKVFNNQDLLSSALVLICCYLEQTCDSADSYFHKETSSSADSNANIKTLSMAILCMVFFVLEIIWSGLHNFKGLGVRSNCH